MSTNAIKWTPGRPPEPQEEKMYLIFCSNRTGCKWTELILGEELVSTQQESIKAHALINYPLTVNEAVHQNETGDELPCAELGQYSSTSWHYWDLNGTTRSTGYATREEAEAAYRDEYGDW